MHPPRQILRPIAFLVAACAAVAIGAAQPRPAIAQDCPLTLGEPSPSFDRRFGSVLAMDGERAVVADIDNLSRPNPVYVFDLATQTEIRRFPAPGVAGEYFGNALAIDGDLVAIGAPNSDDGGHVYVYDLTTGDLLLDVANPDADSDSSFGNAVALRGDRLVVGAPYNDYASGGFDGVAWLFDVETGDLVRELRTRSSRAKNDRFGVSVAIDGGVAFVGSPYDDAVSDGLETGAVYAFDANTGRFLRRIVADDATDGARYGETLAADSGRILTGAITESARGQFAGAAYLADATDGQQIARLDLEEGQARDFFGIAVALKGRHAVVGARLDERRGYAGTAVVFDARTGERLSTLPPGGRNPGDWFGTAVAVGATRVLVGAPRDSDRGREAGEVQIFRLDELPETPIVFDPVPETSYVTFTISIPGYGEFTFRFRIRGRVIAEAPLDCRPPKSFQVTGVELELEDGDVAIEPADGVFIHGHQLGVRLADPGTAAVTGPGGTFTQTIRLSYTGTAQWGILGTGDTVDMTKLRDWDLEIHGTVDNTTGQVTLRADLPETTRQIDFGLGPLNPTLTMSGAIDFVRSDDTFAYRTPSVTRRAAIGLDFAADAKDAVSFSGTIDRRLAPTIGAGTTAVLRIGGYRADVTLDARGRTAARANPLVRIVVPKKRKKPAKFKVVLRRQSLRDLLAAAATTDGLPREVPWSLDLADGWNIGGTLRMDGKDRLRLDRDGDVLRAALRMIPVR